MVWWGGSGEGRVRRYVRGKGGTERKVGRRGLSTQKTAPPIGLPTGGAE